MKNYRGKRLSVWLKIIFALILAGILGFSVLLGIVLHGSHDQIKGDPEIMIILGCQVKPWGPSILLQDRVEKALEYLEDNPDMTIIVSGGQGPDEPMTEAQAMEEALVAQGISVEQIIREDQSHNTNQNLRYSLELLEEKGYDSREDIVVVSNGFHLSRVRMLWKRICGTTDNLSTLAGASSHLPSRLKMYIREPIGLVKSFLLDR